MGNFLYIIAIILVIGWAVGFFAFSAGYLIHVLLVIAIIALLLRNYQGKKGQLNPLNDFFCHI